MLTNYFKITFRNLLKNKGIAATNIFGLSVGLACFALVGLFVLDECTFDRFHPDAENTFRVVCDNWNEDGTLHSGESYVPEPLAGALRSDFPEVVNTVRTSELSRHFVRSSRLTDREDRILYADPSIFQVFSFPLLRGDAVTALNDPQSVVLSEAFAIKYFGEPDPTGRILDIKIADKYEPFTVTGVLKKIPSNSSVVFDLLLSFKKLLATPEGKKGAGNWHFGAFQTYVQLRPGTHLPQDAGRLQDFRRKYYPTEEDEMRTTGAWKAGFPPATYRLQPLLSMRSDTSADGATLHPRYVWILFGIGCMLLFIACINFTTLAIGRSAGRAHEIGLRKVVGAGRRQLVAQFLSEAVLLSAVSMAIALALIKLLLPTMNELSGKNLVVSLSIFPEIIWLMPVVTLATGLLAGLYPALVLSGLKPLAMLRKKLRFTGSNGFTKSLATFQFVLSIGLIICTLVMTRQLDFLRNRYPGFDTSHVVVIQCEDADARQLARQFRQEFGNRQEFEGFSCSSSSFGQGERRISNGFTYKGAEKVVFGYGVDPDFVPVLNMKLLEGRNFDAAVGADSTTSVIVNEALVREFGWSQPVGEVMSGFTDDPARDPVVIGVVQDFNFKSLHSEVQPMIFTSNPHMLGANRIFARVRGGSTAAALSLLQQGWQERVADVPFRFSFLKEDLNRFYQTEARWSRIVGLAGGIAVLLACLGLFGLIALTTVNRTREIGIRKVLGASVAGITALLTKEYLKLVLIAFFIAAPVAWYLMREWLADFAYRIEIQGWMFVLAGLGAGMLAFLTVSFQSIKAALADPVKSLRNE